MPSKSTESGTPPILTLARIRQAAERIGPFIVRTPLLENPRLNERLQARLLLKLEALQHTGSFTFRGACNRIEQLPDAQRQRGVVAWSSGNHGQAVAANCARRGIPATIVMPHTAPRLKIDATRAQGAIVRLYDRAIENREEIGRQISERTGATIIHPYDDPDIMAGQGTVGLEIMQQCAERGLRPDAVLAGVGGGGLIAGAGTAVRALNAATRLYAVEPAGFDDTARSLALGERQSNTGGAESLCDALMDPTPGALTFPLNRALLTDVLVVSDSEVRTAMRACFEHLKIVTEPGGVAPLAAILSGKIDVRGTTSVVVISGGNVDAALFARILQG
ncbi:threonine/serine dehydratase [Gluconacetobacter azotocaptans]|uniref:threonine ammonia-lyase n=1 Tax=Gluconacetobacter azotocaptans TaxID=142834 RepID=UPI0019567A55|nr:threonine/serine dehydratase [Gluconacetobacter azotocaptans]MBM9400667.1 threonine/serine dehydratase [Gluconacetobacter azotocaptans]